MLALSDGMTDMGARRRRLMEYGSVMEKLQIMSEIKLPMNSRSMRIVVDLQWN